MYLPCNIDWIYPTQNRLAKFFMMLKYTLHTFTLTSSHITWVHVTSIQLQVNKILINIYIKILNLEMQVYHCMTHPQKFSPNCPKGTNWTKWAKKIMDNGDIKEKQIPGHIP